jgi:hypothetical protein
MRQEMFKIFISDALMNRSAEGPIIEDRYTELQLIFAIDSCVENV